MRIFPQYIQIGEIGEVLGWKKILYNQVIEKRKDLLNNY